MTIPDPATPAEAPASVRFGPGPTQVIPLDWAERGLAWLHTHRNGTFGAMILHVTGSAPEVSARGRKPGSAS